MATPNIRNEDAVYGYTLRLMCPRKRAQMAAAMIKAQAAGIEWQDFDGTPRRLLSSRAYDNLWENGDGNLVADELWAMILADRELAGAVQMPACERSMGALWVELAQARLCGRELPAKPWAAHLAGYQLDLFAGA